MIDKNLLICISLVILWTCFDLKRTYFNESKSRLSDDTSGDFSIPKTRISTIKIRYCHSCGYRNIFEEFFELVQRHYPTMAMIGENHSPLFIKTLLAKVLSIIKIALFLSLLFGQNPFHLLNISTPRIYLWALQNKMYACLIIFFLSNVLESYLIATGAFEISVNDIPVWSKLQTGRLPSNNEFIQILQPFANHTRY